MGATQLDVKQIAEEVKLKSEPFRKLLEQMHRVILGQDDLLHKMLIRLLSNGHALIEGVPGLAKTTAAASLGQRAVDEALVQAIAVTLLDAAPSVPHDRLQ